VVTITIILLKLLFNVVIRWKNSVNVTDLKNTVSLLLLLLFLPDLGSIFVLWMILNVVLFLSQLDLFFIISLSLMMMIVMVRDGKSIVLGQEV
jgi:cell division protein FtsW (lipid II flippase)